MRLSVVIPALNEERHLGRLLSDLQRQTRSPDEVIVVDAGSTDATVRIAKQSTSVGPSRRAARGAWQEPRGLRREGGPDLLPGRRHRLAQTFLEGFVGEAERRRLDIACPRYLPYGSTPTIRAIHAFWNMVLRASERTLPSGAGHCIVVRGELFRESRGFDPSLKFDDIELVRRLSKGRRFGIVGAGVFVSDRRYKEVGILRTFLSHLLMAPAFALGKFEWTNRVAYEFGNQEH